MQREFRVYINSKAVFSTCLPDEKIFSPNTTIWNCVRGMISFHPVPDSMDAMDDVHCLLCLRLSCQASSEGRKELNLHDLKTLGEEATLSTLCFKAMCKETRQRTLLCPPPPPPPTQWMIQTNQEECICESGPRLSQHIATKAHLLEVLDSQCPAFAMLYSTHHGHKGPAVRSATQWCFRKPIIVNSNW